MRARHTFFGEITFISYKHFTFNHIISENEIIIITSNVKDVNGRYVFVFGNETIHLDDWLVCEAHNQRIGLNFYAVKLHRGLFKDDCFDRLLKLAKMQQRLNLEIALGH